MSTAPFGTTGDGDGGVTLNDLFGESEIDTIWLDLDGDEIPDTKISAYDPADDVAQASTTAPNVDVDVDDSQSDAYAPESGPFMVPSDAFDEVDLDVATPTVNVVDTSDTSWSTAMSQPDAPGVYDLSDIVPQGQPTGDWTDPMSQPYDPMEMWNYSVESGPVIFDPATGDPYCPVDVHDPSLWYNQSSFDDGAGYWDATYAVMPTQPDLTQWQTPDASYTPNGFDAASDPFTFTDASWPADPYSVPGYSDFASDTSWSATPGYDSSEYSTWSSDPTDVTTSYFTDYTFDDQLSEASSNSQFWMDEYNSASDASWDYWQMSSDAANAGDSSLAYDYNQLSLEANSYADSSWANSNASWDSSTTSSSSADDGWYDAMSLDS